MRSIFLYDVVNIMTFVIIYLDPLNVNDATDEFKRIMKQTDSKVLSNYIISAYELRNTTLANK